MALSEKELKEFKVELQKIVHTLAQHDLIKTNENPEKIIDRVIENLQNNKTEMSLDALKNDKDFRKAMHVACMAEAHPQNRFDYTILFKKELDTKELQKQFKNIFQQMLELKPEYKNKSPDERKEIEAMLDKLAEQFSNKVEETYKLDKKSVTINFAASFLNAEPKYDPASQAAIERYGVDIRHTGGVPVVVQAMVNGDRIGVMDGLIEGMVGTDGTSFMAERDNPLTADPLGQKMNDLLNDIAVGAQDIIQLEEQANGILAEKPTYKSPNPMDISRGPGHNDGH